MLTERYTYCITWSVEDGEFVGLCAEFPSLSWLAGTPEVALQGVRRLVGEAVADMESSGEPVPPPLAGALRARLHGALGGPVGKEFGSPDCEYE